ncbi:hypothetical protein E3P92_01783 [Wallemia ichthyophaga]|uniref:Uncharacterized protein n=2 Tax=Wallemia ichthyophaga TaxID=245174 RepID=A0A4T0HEU2_WALIC|nr:uncharacterized protein J056_004456 [Wallemia ichthyophaga EXF-994]TIA99618.1 hypothetical protein E3P95_02042 [Wallemia ichthyophaga]EOR01135.1 hypothetical protein J056_004456 [Wallemia ichthyophaga EXF-994]TIB00604.1 hypothetical protein E3P94_02166 [Wallemia ichthyophaga]TIB14276.1 hypothetical protein E3P90_01329 [Wallemia ichthyophaga]TIB15149.1 hypothetical protein E3P92_01783 [Wallemia ichthyophaga]
MRSSEEREQQQQQQQQQPHTTPTTTPISATKKKDRKPIINWLSKRLGRRSSTNVPPAPGFAYDYELHDTPKPSSKRRSTLNGVVNHTSFSTIKRSNYPESSIGPHNGADDDASLKPLNSKKSISFTSNSIDSDPDTHSHSTLNTDHPDNDDDDNESNTFISKASTKPTTLLSIDPHDRSSLESHQVAQIAQASPSSPHFNPNSSYNSHNAQISYNTPPTYTRPQLHNNPRPLSPPNDDASIMTLASSNAGRIYHNDNSNSITKSSLHSSLKLDDDEFSTRALAPNSRRESFDSNTTQSLRSYNIGTSPLNPIRSPDLVYNNPASNYKKSSTTIATTAASFITASERRQSIDSAS